MKEERDMSEQTMRWNEVGKRMPYRLPEDFSVSRYKSEENLRHTADNVLRILTI